MITKNTNEIDYKQTVLDIAQALDEKKAKNVIVLDVKNITPLADYFVICHGESYTQLNALSSFIEDFLKKHKIRKINEKLKSAEDPWILLDFGFVVIHIFLEESRNFFNLEKLWSDAEIIKEI